MAVRPLSRIKVLGKKGIEEPFRIVGQKGKYFYIPAKTVKSILKINAAFKELRRGKGKVKPLNKPKIVGRGGALGFKPFLAGGQRYLCILAEDLEQLRAVNEEYGKFIKRKRARAKVKHRYKTH